MVFGAPGADMLIASAHIGAGVTASCSSSIRIVEGVKLTPYRMHDGHTCGEYRIHQCGGGVSPRNWSVSSLAVIEQVIDEATAALCAEATGVMG